MKKILENKKVLSLCLALALIAAVGIVNYKLTNPKKEESVETAATDEEAVDVFTQYRNERTGQRAEEISYIDAVIAEEQTDAQTKADAQERKLEIVGNMETELTTEGLISTKMQMDAVVTVKDGAVNVVVNQPTLSEEEVAQIAALVKTQTGEAAQNIKIMPTS